MEGAESASWIFSSRTLPDDKELLPTISNGFVGTRIFDDRVYAAGVFNGDHLSSHRAMIPSTLPLNITLLKEPGQTSETCFTLNAKAGFFLQTINFDNNATQVQQKVYAHKYYRNLIITELKAKTNIKKGCTLLLQSFAAARSVDIDFNNEKKEDYNFMAGFTIKTEGIEVQKIEVAVAYAPTQRVELFIPQSENWQEHFYITSISTSLETKDPKTKAVADFKNAEMLISKDYEAFWKKHENGWNDVWDAGHIKVHGNIGLAQAVNSSFYYILSSIEASWPYGLSPCGLPSNGYLGHTFWDQETWMYPPLLVFHQDLARSCLEYRFERMYSAVKRATDEGYKGLMFPWESAVSGCEVCPEPYPYSKFEHHIVGDIGFAVQQLWMATHDVQWFREKGLLLIGGIAEFWASRVQFDTVKGQYCINHIQGPDEYHYDVNNSTYTNVIAKVNLEFAIFIFEKFEKEVSERWSEIAAKMYIPFDNEHQYHPEFDGYKMATIVKQADVILIGFPLMYEMSRNVRENDMRIYEKYTDRNGPAMTKAMFAIGWLELKNFSLASVSFKEGYANITEPFKIWTEIPGGGEVNFITGAGGFLQSMIFGYIGIRLQMESLHFDPVLPDETTKVELTGITYLGNKINLEYDLVNTVVEVTSQFKEYKKLVLAKQGKKFELKVGAPCKIGSGEFSVMPFDQ